jgi:hypothetical protein
MRNRLRWYIIICTIINLFCWYYVIIFCGVYIKSSAGWLYGVALSLLIEWFGFEIGIPILRGGIRSLYMKYRRLRFLYFIDYLLYLIKSVFS